MKLTKSASYVLLHILNGKTSAVGISKEMPSRDIRSIQRALVRLTDLGLIERSSQTNPHYTVQYEQLLTTPISIKQLEDEKRPASRFRYEFVDWLSKLPAGELEQVFADRKPTQKHDAPSVKMSVKELEYLTIELSWKSSSLEGNTYTLLDTQLLLLEGVKAKNRTEFETQMVLNHKNAVGFIVENPELFTRTVEFRTVEELHRLIGYNLGIDTGIRRQLVKISASNYEPMANPQQLKEAMLTILGIISRLSDPFARAVLALALVPYLQVFEDGNKRTGRMLANALLIHSISQGFSLRKVEAKQLALAYLAFYEFGSIQALANILRSELA